MSSKAHCLEKKKSLVDAVAERRSGRSREPKGARREQKKSGSVAVAGRRQQCQCRDTNPDCSRLGQHHSQK